MVSTERYPLAVDNSSHRSSLMWDCGQERSGRMNRDNRNMSERCSACLSSDIVNRLSLYMGAGISIRHAWERIIPGV